MPYVRDPQRGYRFTGRIEPWMRTWIGWHAQDYGAQCMNPTITDFLGVVGVTLSRQAQAQWARESNGQPKAKRLSELYNAMYQSSLAARGSGDGSSAAAAYNERLFDMLDYLVDQLSDQHLNSWSDEGRKAARRGPVQ
jgi:hypothetical protein